jgi:DNA replication protein DnaC
MNGMDLLKPIIDAANRNNAQADGDYLDDEGLLCCGKCHTRKQLVVPLPEGLRRTETETTMTVGVPCECRKKAIEREEQLERERKEMEAVAALKKQSLMDDRLADANFENFQQTKQNSRHLRLCRRYAECFNEMMEKNQGLLFYGGVGTGKTYAAACIANYLLSRRRSVVMTSFVKLLESMMNFKEDDSVLISRLNRAKLLIIDDLGAERSTDFALEKVYNIVDSRYRAKLPVILTTNLSMDELMQATDIRYTRIYDRIFEMCYPLEFVGRSWRKTEANRRFKEFETFLEGEDNE